MNMALLISKAEEKKLLSPAVRLTSYLPSEAGVDIVSDREERY